MRTGRMTGGKRRAAVLLGALALAAPQAMASMGLRTKFAEVTVENLKIGQTYSLNDLVNFPLRILNTGDEPLPLRIDIVPPGPNEMKPGYEAIPSPGWISLQRSTFTVPPGVEAVTDVMISIPDDPKLLGRRFAVFLWTQSDNIATTGVGLKSRLLLTVSSQRPSDEELKRKFVKKRLANLNFSLSPMEAFATGLVAGKRCPLKDYGAEVKLVNPNSEAYTFRLAPVPIWETSMSPPAGYDSAVDPKWLEVGKTLVKAKPDSIQPLDLAVRIPAEDRYRGKRFFLILRAEILEQDITAYAFVKILVETAR